MSNKMQQVLENIKGLSLRERATLAHCLISGLDQANDEGVDEAWAELAESRFAQLQSGDVTAVTWDQIKNSIKKWS